MRSARRLAVRDDRALPAPERGAADRARVESDSVINEMRVRLPILMGIHVRGDRLRCEIDERMKTKSVKIKCGERRRTREQKICAMLIKSRKGTRRERGEAKSRSEQ